MREKLFSVQEYYQMAERGFFDNLRVELLEGVVVIKPSEATAICLADTALREAFGDGFVYSIRLPIRFDDSSEPEPEVYVVKGKIRDFTASHPKNAELIIEASELRLKFLRSQKASLYAKFGVRDYWIINLKDTSLEVYRRPMKDEAAFYGFSYRAIQTYAEKDSVAPLAAPNAKIKVAALLP